MLFKKAYADSLDLPVKALITKAQHHKLAVRSLDVRHRLADYRAKQKANWLARMKPFVGPDGRTWPIPWHPEVVCESGGNYRAGYAGAFGLIDTTWSSFGGPALSGAAHAGDAKPLYQDIIAARVWAAHGASAWTPYETGCAAY